MTAIDKPLYWNHSVDLFAMLHTRQIHTQQLLTDKRPTYNAQNEQIVIFHCDNRKLFSIEEGTSFVMEFIDIDQCVQFITNASQAQIFLIISGNIIPDILQEIFDSKHIHAVYFFRTNKPKYPTNRNKVSGLFTTIGSLSEQLCTDILFYREQHVHISRIDIFSKIEHEKKLISQLNQQQINLLKFNLLIDILPQTPSLQLTSEDIENECETCFIRTIDKDKTKFDIKSLNIESTNLEFSQISLRLHQLNKLNSFFILQKQLADIQQNVLQSHNVSFFRTVYFAKILSTNDFEIMQQSCNEIISIGLFLLATQSLMKARYIARQAAKNGLLSVLFETEVIYDTHLLNIDADRVMFRLGTVFRLESINKGLDDVHYIKIKSFDSEFQLIKERLQFEIEVPLTWLTFGVYLSSLNCFEQAEAYYMYLIAKLPSGHANLSSIYNNLAMMYYMNGTEDKANYYYMFALRWATSTGSSSASNSNSDQCYIVNPSTKISFSKTHITLATILGNIADVHYKNNNHEKALEFYKRAFELATDQDCLVYYQQMIVTLLKNL